jgi:hypothetical protein
MGEGTSSGLLANGFAQAHRGSPPFAPGAIAFGKSLATPEAPEATFVQHQFDPMASQRHIPFASQAHIVLFDTDGLAMRTLGPIGGGDHFDSHGAIPLDFLLENAQVC